MKLLREPFHPQSSNPDDARRRRLLNILLGGLFIIAILTLSTAVIATLWGFEGQDRSWALSIASAVTVVGIVIIYLINRYRSGPLAGSLFLVLLTLGIALADEPYQVVEGRSVFLFTIPILMASVILRPWGSFLLAGLVSLIITPIALRAGIVPPLPTMLGFQAFALIAWLSARSLENALSELRAINRELDQRVEDRTLALREANDELARANERLRELDRLKSRFVSMVSHELRTPLGAIQGFAEMLQAGVYGSLSDKQDNALYRIEKNTQRLLTIVNDLLDQARIEAGELSIHPEPFAPEALVEDLETTVGVLAEQKGLQMTIDIDQEVPRPLYGDKARLHQVLVNLTNNAIKFTDEGSIHIRVGPADGDCTSRWVMEVSDTGPGISEKDQGMIFTPFRRVDDSITREHTGVGLGLSIVEQLVELMDGEITLESKPGQGSTFAVILPLGNPQRRDFMNDRSAVIIEDNEDLGIIFAEALEAAGFETTLISDGERALDQLKASVPRIIILDLHLPHVSGEAILERVRGDQRFDDTRVVIATADPRMADMLKEKADLVLLKPISFGQLRDLAARLTPRESGD